MILSVSVSDTHLLADVHCMQIAIYKVVVLGGKDGSITYRSTAEAPAHIRRAKGVVKTYNVPTHEYFM